jgi:acetyl esterase
MTHTPHPEMATILRAMRAAPVPEPWTLPLQQARANAAAGSVGWNHPVPEAERRDIVLGGVPCRVLLPPQRSPGVILMAHGGGWTFGSPDSHDRFARLLARAAGLTLVMPEYRLAPEHAAPAAIEDMVAVAQALPGLAEAAGPMVLAGDSAGANIALAVALSPGAPRATLLSLYYGCFAPDFDTLSHRTCGDGSFGLSTARMRWFWENWLGTVRDPRAMPGHAELAGLPRTHLVAAGLDCLRDDSILLAGRLAAAGVPFRLDVVPGVMHGFLQMTRELRPAREAIDLIGAEIKAAISAAQGE